jgi:hypothetical protein
MYIRRCKNTHEFGRSISGEIDSIHSKYVFTISKMCCLCWNRRSFRFRVSVSISINGRYCDGRKKSLIKLSKTVRGELELKAGHHEKVD